MCESNKRENSKRLILYAFDINKLVTDKQYKLLFSIISSRTKRKISNFKFLEDRKRALCGEVLARYAINKEMKVADKEIVLDVKEKGKPYCKSFPKIHFNISHSCSWVVCAVSENPIGVDIEKIGLPDLQIAKYFFTNQEYQYLLRQQEKKTEIFYKLWTLKESYIKYTGRGLTSSLSSFEFEFDNDNVKLKFPVTSILHFMTTKVFENYYVSICSEETYELIEVKQITVKEIEKFCVT